VDALRETDWKRENEREKVTEDGERKKALPRSKVKRMTSSWGVLKRSHLFLEKKDQGAQLRKRSKKKSW